MAGIRSPSNRLRYLNESRIESRKKMSKIGVAMRSREDCGSAPPSPPIPDPETPDPPPDPIPPQPVDPKPIPPEPNPPEPTTPKRPGVLPKKIRGTIRRPVLGFQEVETTAWVEGVLSRWRRLPPQSR